MAYKNNVIALKKGGMSRKRISEYIFFGLLVFWPIAHFCVFYIGVNFNAIILCFKTYDVNSSYDWVFLDNFKRVFYNLKNDPVVWYSIRNSILIYFVGLPFTLGLGQIFSYYIYKKMKFNKFFKIILFLPSIMPGIALILIFKYFTERILPSMLLAKYGIQFDGLLSNPSTALYTMMFYAIWMGFGGNVLIYSSAMSSTSDSCIEAAQIDGANVIQEYLHVVFPSIYKTFSVYFVMGFIGLFSDQLQLFSLYGTNADSRLYTIGYYLYRNTLVADLSDYPYLSAIGMIITLIAVPMTFLLKHWMNKIGPSAD